MSLMGTIQVLRSAMILLLMMMLMLMKDARISTRVRVLVSS